METVCPKAGQSGEPEPSPAARVLAVLAVVALLLGAAWWLHTRHEAAPIPPAPVPAPTTQPEPAPAPEPAKPDKPRKPLIPRPQDGIGQLVYFAEAIEALKIAGPLAPDGATEVQCDLPPDQRLKNTGGMGPRGPGSGAGLCVFTSIEHAGRWSNEERLIGFQKKMTHEPGGGYPAKVDTYMKKYAAGVAYIQFEGRDPAILVAALASGRMPAVTYDGHDPHYGMNRSIAHMVNLVAFDPKTDLACVLDNNFVGENDLVWMTCQEFLQRWRGSGAGWCVILLNAPPPPVPRSLEPKK